MMHYLELMTAFTFEHAADIHLNSPPARLSQKDEAFSVLVRGVTRQAFSNVIDLAVNERTGFVEFLTLRTENIGLSLANLQLREQLPALALRNPLTKLRTGARWTPAFHRFRPDARPPTSP